MIGTALLFVLLGALLGLLAKGAFRPRDHEKDPAPAPPTKPLNRPSIRCAPERIRESPVRGGCGVLGCPIRKPHSHAADLRRRLKEMSKR